jgi:hypothetical protein
MKRVAILALAFSVGGGAGEKAYPQTASSPLSMREVASPAEPGSGEPNLTSTAGGQVVLTWIERKPEKRHALRYALRTKGGEWGEARTISEGADWFVNWADFPSVAALPDGTLFAHWLTKSGAGKYAYDVRVATSRDAGKSWSAPVVPHRDGTQTEHGFVSMTPWSATEMGIVWLDGRKTAGAAHGAHGGAGSEMALVHTALAVGGKLGAETVLDDRVCDCCQTDVARAEGATVVVYRDRSPTEVRDMSVVRFADGRWSEPRAIAHDGWEINGCPVNGPAIAAAGARVVAAWFSAPSEKPRVAVAFSADAGATFGAPVTVDEGKPLGRVDVVVLEDGAALVSWLEQSEKGARLRVRRVAPEGTRGEPLTVAESSAARSSGFPRLALSGGEVIIAWRDGSEPPKVRTAVISVPAQR